MESQRKKTVTTSTSLIVRIQHDDQAAWARLEFLYHRLVFYWCKKQKVPRNDWEDITQAVFQTVHHYIGDFIKHDGKASFRPWLRAITLTRILDFRKGLKNVPVLLSDTATDLIKQSLTCFPDDPTIDDEAEKETLIGQAMEIVKSEVAPKTWEAFYQTAIAGNDSFIVSKMLGMTAANVRKAKSNVLKRLRDEFEGLLD